MSDFLLKFRQYFTSSPNYWKLSDEIDTKYTKVYPLSFKDRLFTGHYIDFDEKGIPMSPSKSGELVHFITTMTSYGLANWEMFLITQDTKYADALVTVAKYLANAVEFVDDVGMLYDYESDTRSKPGLPCAMNQGEAISIMVRAYSYTKDRNFISTAESLMNAFSHPFGPKGVTKKIENKTWFLEGGKLILNGHIYAMLGLYDLFSINDNEKAEMLFHEGLNSVVHYLPSFDSGFWSWYWMNKPKYMSSAMYHNLHICQLKILFNISGLNDLNQYAEKFDNYARQPLYRILSGFFLFIGKIRMKFNAT